MQELGSPVVNLNRPEAEHSPNTEHSPNNLANARRVQAGTPLYYYFTQSPTFISQQKVGFTL